MLRPGDRFGDYTVVTLLGKGGMGLVFLLRNAAGGQVAAKILDPGAAGDHEARKRFLREAEFACGVKHPNLVETYDVGEDPDTGLCYILMEYVPGGSLADRLKAGPLAINDAIRIVYQIAYVLELARQKGIVHRDIKPGNIMFGADGKAKLADLGIARGGLGGTDTTTVTQTGMMIGTPAYMAPEQMLDAHNVDTRADIYSLGIVFYEMLAGKRPNADDTVVQLMAKAVKGEPIPDVRTMRPEVSASLAQLLSMMVAPDKDGRISTPGQITSALGIIARGGEFEVKKPTARDSGRARTPVASPSAERRASFLWKALVPVGVFGVFAAVFVLLAPKRTIRQTVTTDVVERAVENHDAVTNVVYVQGGAAADKKAKDGKYICETPEGEWSYHVRDGKAWLGGDDKPALYPQPTGVLRLPASLGGVQVVGISHRAFQNCRELEAVEIPDGYEIICSHAFHDCTALTRASLPKTIQAVHNCAFCNSKISSLDLNRMSDWDSTFLRGMSRLEEVRFDARNRQFVNEGGMILSKDRTRLLFVPRSRSAVSIPETVTRIEGSACDTSAIRSLVIPGRVRHIGHMAFSYCGELRKIAFPDGDIHFEGQVFQWNTNLVEIKFGEGIRYLDEWAIFGHCRSLREVRLPDSLETMGAGTFEDATSLERVHFGRSLRRIGYRSFAGATSLNAVTLPPSLREMGAECFWGCRTLRHVLFEGDAPTLIDNDSGQRGVDIFMGTPRDLVVFVKRGSKGWNPDGNGLPERWPVGAGVHARTIRYADEDIGSNADKKTFDPEKLKDSDPTRAVQKALDALFPGWKASEIGDSGSLGYWREREGETDVICTHPPRRGVPAVLSKTLVVEGKSPVLHVRIANNELGSQFRLRVRVAGKVVREKDITSGWTDVYVDLRRWSGKTAKIELEHLPTGWRREWAFWSVIEVVDDVSFVDVAALQDAEPFVKIHDRRQVVGTNPKMAAQRTCDVLFPGWKISECGHPEAAGYEEEHKGRYNLLFTHPPREDVPVVISRRMTLPRKTPKLYVSVIGGDDFELQVKVNGKIIQSPVVDGREWTDLEVDLSEWAGKNVLLEVLNMPTGWRFEEAHWQRLEVK